MYVAFSLGILVRSEEMSSQDLRDASSSSACYFFSRCLCHSLWQHFQSRAQLQFVPTYVITKQKFKKKEKQQLGEDLAQLVAKNCYLIKNKKKSNNNNNCNRELLKGMLTWAWQHVAKAYMQMLLTFNWIAQEDDDDKDNDDDNEVNDDELEAHASSLRG